MTQLSDEEIIAALREVDVPEPSPLFWDHLSQRVRDAVADEPLPPRGWSSRFNLAWAAGILGATVAVALAVVVTIHYAGPAGGNQAALSPANRAQAGDSLHASEDDASWAVMGDLASQMDFEQAAEAGLIATPGSADRALGQLSQDEQRAAVELLQREIKNSRKL
ncbi:MAG TPA: hypothetical protein VGZ27_00695 [Vicinamibacterales bacterium]|jgi:hypothetical protein|nr:hypothetical protein [Vicinamibacterales bacterium]